MNRPLRLALGGALVAFALACGGGGTAPPPPTPTTTGTSTSTAPPPPAPPTPTPVAQPAPVPTPPPPPTRDQLLAKSKELLSASAGSARCTLDAYVSSAENLAATPGGTGTTLLPTGTRVEVAGALGDYVLVAASPSMNLTEPGWVHASSLAVKLRENLNMRRGKEAGKATGLARRDKEAALLTCDGDNVKIRTGGDEGWVDSRGVCGNPTGCS